VADCPERSDNIPIDSESVQENVSTPALFALTWIYRFGNQGHAPSARARPINVDASMLPGFKFMSARGQIRKEFLIRTNQRTWPSNKQERFSGFAQ